MRVIIERGQLLKSLGHVQSVVERRNIIPILSNVHLRADGNNIQLTATDNEIEIIEQAPADVAAQGATTVPAHLIHDIVRKLPDGAQLEIEQGPDEGRLSIIAGRSRFTLQALPADEFPKLAADDLTHNFTINSSALKNMIAKTKFAISTEETRYYLNGIYIHSMTGESGELLRAVATDGHRLAKAEISCPEGASGIPGIIIPRKTVLELTKLLENDDGDVEIALSDSKIRFAINGIILTSKLIDGSFPDYERVIPLGNDKLLEVDRRLFAQAVDRVSTVSADKGKAIKLNINADKVVLAVNNPDSGSAEEEVAAMYDNETIDIGFNSQYLLDIAAQLEGNIASFYLSDSGSPTIVRDSEDESVLYVLMPMRV